MFNIFKKKFKSSAPSAKPESVDDTTKEGADGKNATGGEWVYSETVRKHFFEPKNFTSKAPDNFSGLGMVGSPACGDMMKVWIKVDEKEEKITDFKWQTFGCASAIASTSVLSEMVIENGGMKIKEALKITPTDILKRLSGLPDRKVHCSVLGDKALEAAINDYYKKSGQHNKVKEAGARIIDKKLNITEKDIEQAVKEGAKTVAEVQAKTKVGTDNKDCLPEVEELVKFYVEKHHH